jgi:subtilisin-like proprotein convertase family protein
MVKATLMNGTRRITGSGANDTLWSNAQGMGRIDLSRAFDPVARLRVDQTQILGATGQTYTLAGTIATSAQPLRVTLAWTDAPGPTTGNAYVNNLDLEVTVNGTLYRGNVFSGGNSIAGGAADPRNNVESVFLPAGATGSFQVVVRATNVAGDGVPGNADTTDQDFALLVYNGSQSAPQPDFSLSATPASQTVTAGGGTSYAVTVAGINGFGGNVALSASPAIAGVSYSFSPASVTGSGNSTLNVTTTTGATVGTHGITITGTSGATSRTTNVSLTVNGGGGGGGNVVKTASAAPNVTIPDNQATGVASTIAIANSLTISSVAVSTVIPHPYKGDLVVTLIGPDGTSAILHGQSGGSADNVTTTFALVTAPAQSLAVFNGKNSAGNWQLRCADLASSDVGTLSAWTLTINGEKTAAPNVTIPDNNATGVTSTQNYTATGTVAAVKVRVNVTHPYKGDLVLTLIGPDGTAAILHNRTGGSADHVQTAYPDLTAPAQSLAVFTGKAIQGNWQLRCQDLAGQDVGTLVNWTLSLTAQ